MTRRAEEREPIRVWRFHEAPEEFRNAFSIQDDVDWLAFVPASYRNDYDGGKPSWIEFGTFGPCEVEERVLDSGTIYAGYHA